MSEHHVDVVVVGMGPGGEEAAGRLGQAGLKVVGIEPHLVGGEYPYYGCIPSKMIVRAAGLLAEANRVNAMAGSATVVPDFSMVADRMAGRTPNLTGIGLGTVGLDERSRPAITTEEQMRVVGTESLWAVGDIAGRGAFTHMAVYEAAIAVDDILEVNGPLVAEYTRVACHLHRNGGRLGGYDRSPGARRRHQREDRACRLLHLKSWLASRVRQRRSDETDRRRGP